MKKVLMLGPVPPPYGGIAAVMDTILHSSLTKDYSFDIFEREGIFPPGYSGFIGKNVFRLKRFLRFFKELREKQHDFIHLQSVFNGSFSGTIIFMLIARLTQTKILLHLHGTDWDTWYTRASKWKQFRNRTALRIPSQILVLYKVWQTNINRLIPNAEVHVLGNWIEMREAPDSTEVVQAKRDLGISKENFTVITVGFVGWRKGSYDILDAVPVVAQACDSVRFIFVGGEEYSGEIGPFNERVQNENLGKWVLFTGEVPREKVPGYLACADVFLLPSHREGMPISIIEAMRGGVPIISTLVGAIPEMIENGTSGILINPGAPDEIAEAVLSLKRDDSLRRRLAEGSRRAFEEKYEISKGIHELASVYRSMCSE